MVRTQEILILKEAMLFDGPQLRFKSKELDHILLITAAYLTYHCSFLMRHVGLSIKFVAVYVLISCMD